MICYSPRFTFIFILFLFFCLGNHRKAPTRESEQQETLCPNNVRSSLQCPVLHPWSTTFATRPTKSNRSRHFHRNRHWRPTSRTGRTRRPCANIRSAPIYPCNRDLCNPRLRRHCRRSWNRAADGRQSTCQIARALNRAGECCRVVWTACFGG